MKTLDWYIIRKFLGTFFYSIALLSIVIIIFDVSEKLDDFFEKDVPLKEIIFTYYVNFLPYFINLFSYLFTFIAVIYFTSRMAMNTEITAILCSGVSYYRLLRPYLIASVFLAVMSFILSNFVIPITNQKMDEFEKQYLKGSNRRVRDNFFRQISPGTFISLQNFNNETKSGFKINIDKFDGNNLVFSLNAERMVWDSISGQWKIFSHYIRRFDGNRESLTFRQNMDTTLNLHPRDFVISVGDTRTMDFFHLNKFIREEKMKGSEKILDYEVEKHKRIAFPFATVILTLMGVSLSSRKVRGGIGVHLGAGIGLTFSFIFLMQVTTVFARFSSLNPALSVWIPIVLFGIIGLFLLLRAQK